METPVTFVNRGGHRLFGMLYLPEQGMSRHVGIVVSVNAVKYRAGTFRLHVLLARHLCKLGYTLFTFDPQGIGDSEGEFEYKLLSEHYYEIQTGKYSNDLADAIDYFRSACQLDSLLLCGLCGGAISVLMEAAADRQVAGLILLNIPVLLEDMQRLGRTDNAAKITSSESASVLLKDKMHRLAEWNFWKRLLHLEVDIAEEASLVRKAASVMVQKVWAGVKSRIMKPKAISYLDHPVSDNRLYSMHFQRSFVNALTSGKQLLLVFGELDPWTWIFKSEFQEHALTKGNAFEGRYRIEVIKSANHIFSAADSQQQLNDCITGWLHERFAVK